MYEKKLLTVEDLNIYHMVYHKYLEACKVHYDSWDILKYVVDSYDNLTDRNNSHSLHMIYEFGSKIKEYIEFEYFGHNKICIDDIEQFKVCDRNNWYIFNYYTYEQLQERLGEMVWLDNDIITVNNVKLEWNRDIGKLSYILVSDNTTDVKVIHSEDFNKLFNVVTVKYKH